MAGVFKILQVYYFWLELVEILKSDLNMPLAFTHEKFIAENWKSSPFATLQQSKATNNIYNPKLHKNIKKVNIN